MKFIITARPPVRPGPARRPMAPVPRPGGVCRSGMIPPAGKVPRLQPTRARRSAFGSRRPGRAATPVRRSRIGRFRHRSTAGISPAMRSSFSRISRPSAPWPTQGSISSVSRIVTARPAGASPPCQTSAGGDLEMKPAQSGGGQDRGVDPGLARQFLQAGVDIAANFHHLEIRPQRQNLRFAPRAAGGNGQTRRKIGQFCFRLESIAINQNVANVRALSRDRAQFQAVGQFASADLSGCGRPYPPGF